MTVYSFNKGIGWASSGVEYAQLYRAESFRKSNIKAKFIFTDYISADNVADLTENMGFKDNEVVWLYTAFTDFPVTKSTYTLEQLTKTFSRQIIKLDKQATSVKYYFADSDWTIAYLKKNSDNIVARVEYVTNGNLLFKKYFSSKCYMCEYYAPVNNQATVYQRSYFNVDGTVAYDEIIDGDDHIYKFKNEILYSKRELIAYYVKQLHLTSDDVILIDRASGQGQEILENKGSARVGTIVHADHYSEPNTNADNILWNNYYEYEFQHYKDIDFYITATDAQKKLLQQQFKHYLHVHPKVFTIPVGSIEQLHKSQNRKPYSLITASRLATEKHIDWLVKAVAKVHKTQPQVSLDIYGEGGQRDELAKLIHQLNATEYIHLMGHQDLTDVYQHYTAYVAASTSEGFGLTLLEAIGSGLAMVGFDVRYGNQTFIENNKNGVLIPYDAEANTDQKVNDLANAINKLFTSNLKQYSNESYKLAENYLTPVVAKKWDHILSEVIKYDKSI